MDTAKADREDMLFCDYYEQWIKVYKEGAIRDVTMQKYTMAHNWLKKLVPELLICNLDRISYQNLLNPLLTSHLQCAGHHGLPSSSQVRNS